jgi:hypothetical protein
MALQESPSDHAAHVCGTSTVGSIDLPSGRDFPRSSINSWASLMRRALVHSAGLRTSSTLSPPRMIDLRRMTELLWLYI